MSEEPEAIEPLTVRRFQTPEGAAAALAELLNRLQMPAAKAAKIGKVRLKTLMSWLEGAEQPNPPTALGVYYFVACHKWTARGLRDSHHLYLDPKRGFQMRVTLETNTRHKNLRIKRTLGTRDVLEAITMRDLLIAEYRRMGLDLSMKCAKHREPETL